MAADGREEKNRQKWDRIVEKGVENVLKDQPEAFLRRARRGIPSEYRYALLLFALMHVHSKMGGLEGLLAG